MPLINKYGLPQPIFNAIAKDPYSIGTADISVTQLIGPPQIRILWKRHMDKIEVDIVERFWSLCGQAMHVILSRSAGDTVSSERRMAAQVGGWSLSGAMDLYTPETKTLSDYKFVGQYSYKTAKEKMKPEWEAQLNIYAWLLKKTQRVDVEKLEIVALLRDWMQSKVGTKDYPPVPIQVLPVRLWHFHTTNSLIVNRILDHQIAEKMADDKLPECTDEERWMRDEKPVRCMQYCPVRSVCHQHKRYLQEIIDKG